MTHRKQFWVIAHSGVIIHDVPLIKVILSQKQTGRIKLRYLHTDVLSSTLTDS